MLQGQRDLVTVGQMLLSELAPLVDAHQGTIYHLAQRGRGRSSGCCSVYADSGSAGHPEIIRIGEGLVGQCAVDKQRILLTDVPPALRPITSSLATPRR